MHYLAALDILHQNLSPSAYVEIGCRKGGSLALARCPTIAIDPDFEIRHGLQAPTRIYKETSDAFFAKHDLTALIGGPLDMAFIDGMHKAEYALRDFINIERHAHSQAVILIDDILPGDMSWTTRERETQAWNGDVYKIIPLLRAARPDLKIDIFDIDMKGLALISNLSPQNTTLADSYKEHEAFLLSPNSELASVEEIRTTLAPRPVSELAAFAEDLAIKRQQPQSIGPTGGAHEAYLALLKRSLLNEIYLDDELRLLYLRDCLAGGLEFDYSVYHDIRNAKRDDYEALQAARQIGRFPDRNIHRSGFSHTMIGRKRMDNLHQALDIVRTQNLPGDFIECGVWRGGSCIFMAAYAAIHGMSERTIFMADSFDGLPAPSLEQDSGWNYSKDRFPELAVSLETVRENFEVYGLGDAKLHFLKGWFKDTLAAAPIEKLALLRLDGDLYESTMDAMTALYPKVVPGGVVIIDDYALPVCKQAIDDYFKAQDMPAPLAEQIDWVGVWWRKDG